MLWPLRSRCNDKMVEFHLVLDFSRRDVYYKLLFDVHGHAIFTNTANYRAKNLPNNDTTNLVKTEQSSRKKKRLMAGDAMKIKFVELKDVRCRSVAS